MERVEVLPAVVRAHRPGRLRRRDRTLGVVLLAPAIGYILLLVGVPFLLAVVLGFTDATAGSLRFDLVGLRNFREVVSDPGFRRALLNTFLITGISLPSVLVLGHVLATALLPRFRGRRVVRFLLLMPWAAPISLATLAWLWMFDSTFSVINWLLRLIGWLGPGQWYYWLGDPVLGLVAITVVQIWRLLPFATVLLLAGLTSIPGEVLEAAAVDGAGTLATQVYVTIPMMLPIAAVAVLFGIVFTFTDMSVVYLLTHGGPYNSTHVLASLAFQDGVLGADVGRGAAVATFLLPLLAVSAVWVLRSVRRGGDA